MLYLLLDEQKKKVKREYVLRAVFIFLVLFSITLILWIISLLPAFARVQIERGVIRSQEDNIAQVALLQDGTSLEEYVRDINQKISLLSEEEIIVSELINEIVSRQIRSIRLNAIEFISNTEENRIMLSGVANTRDSLVEFGNLLEEHEKFVSVDVPFSSFAESSDIPFTLTIQVEK